MAHTAPSRDSARPTRPSIPPAVLVSAVLLIVAARLFTVHGDPGFADGPRPPAIGNPDQQASGSPDARGRPGRPNPGRSRASGAPIFHDQTPEVANLDPALLDALRQAATDAAGAGVEFRVNSGWRSAEHQEQLLRDAIAAYGSEEEASLWVATPETSAHVSGDAVDIGPAHATAWLSERGWRYGLCQIYDNEPWHYELRPEALDGACPPMYANPTQDPRMQQ